MRFRLIFLFLFLLMLPGVRLAAQSTQQLTDSLPDNVLMEKQWSLGILLHTNGWGLKFRKGKNITASRQFMWEIEFTTYKSLKEYRMINPYFSDSKSYIYGKMNYVYFLRGGIGQQHVLNRKPYWGGVQLSAIYYGGLSLCITKPVYLYIIHFLSPNLDYEIDQERYNPEIHYVDNIYGRAPFLTGITNMMVYPGLYVKGGLECEFGTQQKRIQALEAGVTIDFSPIAVPVMAYNPKQNFFVTVYLSFSLGKRAIW
jgi:hypothetical protein